MVLEWGSALSVTAAFFCLVAAVVVRVTLRTRRLAFYLLVAANMWFFPVHLWFWQFMLTGRMPTGGGYILEAVIQIVAPVAWLIWSCFHRFRPVVTALVLIYLFSLVLQLFSYIYWAYGNTANFNVGLSHLDSFYFALGTLTTAGTGSLSAISETARGLQTLQMGLDLAIVGFAVALVMARYSNLFPRIQPRARRSAVRAVELKAKIAEVRRLLDNVEAALGEEGVPAETHEPMQGADRPRESLPGPDANHPVQGTVGDCNNDSNESSRPRTTAVGDTHARRKLRGLERGRSAPSVPQWDIRGMTPGSQDTTGIVLPGDGQSSAVNRDRL